MIVIPGLPGPGAQHLESEILASYLRQRGHEVALLNFAHVVSVEEGLRRLASTAARLIYFHLPQSPEIEVLQEWDECGLIELGEESPPLVVAGGHVATHFACELIERIGILKAVIKGELELPIAWLLEKSPETPWSDGPSLVFRNPKGGFHTQPASADSPIDLADLPATAPEQIALSKRSLQRVLVSRGCRSACSYCGFTHYFSTLSTNRSRLWRARPAIQIVDEIETLKVRYGQENFALNAAVFFGYDEEGSRSIGELCDELIRRRLEIRFQIITHPGHLVRNASLLPRLQKAGLVRVSLGLDGGSDEALSRFGVEFSVEQGLEALGLLARHSIEIIPLFIFYDPYTTAQNIRDQIQFLEKARPYFQHERRSYAYFLEQYFLKNSLETKAFMPIAKELEADGLVELDAKEPWKRLIPQFAKAYMRTFYRTHRRVNRELLAPLRPILWSRRWIDAYPEIEMLPLDLVAHLASNLQEDSSGGSSFVELGAFEGAWALIQERLEPLRPAIKRLSSERGESILAFLEGNQASSIVTSHSTTLSSCTAAPSLRTEKAGLKI